MSQAPYLTLTEAITALAFNDPVSSADINDVMASNRWGSDRAMVLDKIAGATNDLCDAGFAEKIECWGVPTNSDPYERAHAGSSAKLTRHHYLDYRRFICGFDTLWEGIGEANEAANAFAGFTGSECLCSVKVERTQLDALLQERNGSPKFSDKERAQWIVDCAERNGDDAYRLFRQHPKWDGTNQAVFRLERKKLLDIAGRGRPKS